MIKRAFILTCLMGCSAIVRGSNGNPHHDDGDASMTHDPATSVDSGSAGDGDGAANPGMPHHGHDAGKAHENGDASPEEDAGPDLTGDAGPAVFTQDFNELKAGSTWLKSCKWNKHTAVTESCGIADSQCLRIAHDPTNKEPPLFPLPPVDERPPYPDGSKGVCPPYYTNTGTDVVQQIQPIPPGDEYSLSYDVFFEDGYDWARGGKLPGLSAKEWDSGCSIEGDGIPTDPGPARWSVRLMWRSEGTNELYVYDQDRIPGACGTRSPTEVPFSTGRWFAVTLYVRLNSAADAADGEARFYLDGKLLRREKDLKLRSEISDDSRINNIFFSTFFGGNESKRLYCHDHAGEAPYCKVPDPNADVTWVPKDLAYVRFDNLEVRPGLAVRESAQD
jgi:hypothetical protein